MRLRWFLLTAILLYACGEDTNPVADAEVHIDASMADASGPDAFNACPGKATFQVGVEDWLSGEAIAGVAVSNGSAQASSAPNGRVVLCVNQSGVVEITFAHADYLAHTHSTSGELVAQLATTSGVASFRLLKPSDADALYLGIGKTRDSDKTTAMAMVRDRASGNVAAGASISLSVAHEGAYTPGNTEAELNPGQVTQDDGLVLLLNAEPEAAAVTASGLSNCESPMAVSLVAGGTSSMTIVCSL